MIKFTTRDSAGRRGDDEEEEMIEWDWIGEDSPMVAGMSEPEFLLERLCESLGRYVRRMERAAVGGNEGDGEAELARRRDPVAERLRGGERANREAGDRRRDDGGEGRQ